MLISQHYAGIIAMSYGSGHLNEQGNELIKQAAIRNIFVVRTSVTAFGPVHNDERIDNDMILAGGDLSPVKSRILLTLALSKGSEKNNIRKIFEEY